MTNEEIVIAIQSGGDMSGNMLLLWKQNQGLIHKIAKHYSYHEEVEDLIQQSYLGLHQAVINYRPQEGISFCSYLALLLRRCLSKYCCDNGSVRIPSGRMNAVFQYKKLQQEFMVSLGWEPTNTEIADILGIDRVAVQRLKQDAIMRQVTSLDAPIIDADASEISLGDTISDETIDVEESVIASVQQKQLSSALRSAVDMLPEEQASVIKGRYLDGETLEVIGQRLNCAGYQARTIQENGLRKLRKNKMLREFADDEIFRRGVNGGGIKAFRNTWSSSTEKTALWRIEHTIP